MSHTIFIFGADTNFSLHGDGVNRPSILAKNLILPTPKFALGTF